MSSTAIADEIHKTLPGIDEVIVEYLSGYLVDDASEEDDVLQVARDMLGSAATGDCTQALERLMSNLTARLKDLLDTRKKAQGGSQLLKLDKVVDMSQHAMSNTLAFSEGVDLESINKAKCVNLRCGYCFKSNVLYERESRVDVKRLEKQETKLRVSCMLSRCQICQLISRTKAKIEKRAKRDLYEGSKLLQQHRKQVEDHVTCVMSKLICHVPGSKPTKRCSCRCECCPRPYISSLTA